MKPFVVPSVLLSIALIIVVMDAAADMPEDLRISILALSRIRDNVQEDFARADSTRQRSESSSFLIFLSSRIQADCQALRRLSPGAIAGLPCNPAAMNSAASFAQARSEGEKVADLDSRLRGQLQDFDDMLLAEHESMTATGVSGAGTNGDGTRGGETGAQSRSGDDRLAQVSTGPNEQNESAAYPGPCPDDQECGQGLPPADDDQLGEDDDIVARQLREAAEQEQDPELKEKLWEEYYRYKNSGAPQ